MLRYKTKTRPGLVALYDIRPVNRAGPFLQPRSPHGAITQQIHNIPVAESMFTPLDLFVCLQNTPIVISKCKSCSTSKRLLFTQVIPQCSFYTTDVCKNPQNANKML